LTTDLPGLIKLDKPMAVPVLRMLSRAFLNYPLMTHFFPEEPLRQRVCDNMLAMPIYTCLRYGEIYATSRDLEGAAIWSPSEDYPVSFWRLLRSVPWRYVFGMAQSGVTRLQAVDRFVNDIHQRLVPDSHLYLEILGVDPPFQKKGFSSKLVRPMLQRLDSEKKSCYLETQDPQDVAIYQHFGFKVIDQSTIPDTPLSTWAMLRKPQ
jgi:ribosomal protein S18 acetylase RimI-like enzyme